MKQPYIYTLPERFISDPAVPFRWKLYTLLNGFWIAGKPVFASNAWFAEKLGCSERTIQEGLLELERMYLITRHGGPKKRRIIPGGHGTPPESENSLPHPQCEEPHTQRAPITTPSVPHIADSNADNKIGETSVSQEPILIQKDNGDDEPKVKKPRKLTPEARAVFDLFGKKCFALVGIRKQEIEAAIFLSENFPSETLKAAISYVEEHRDDPHFFTVNTPYALRVKWLDLKAHKNKYGN